MNFDLRLGLDFVKQPPFWQKLSWLSALLCGFGLATWLYSAHLYQQQLALNADLNQRLTQQQTLLKPVAKPAVKKVTAAPISDAERKMIQTTLNDLNAPWHSLLVALEQLDMKEIALLGLEPDRQKHELILEGQGKNMTAVLHYVELLEGLPMLHQVHLKRHELDDVDANHPVNFTILAQWS